MFNFKEIDSKLVNSFNTEHSKGHIFQTSYWAEIKREWKSVYFGGYDENENIVLTAMMLVRRVPYINKFIGYIPRGFTCDYTNTELVASFTKFLREYARKNRIGFITIDPDIHLSENEEYTEYGRKISRMLIDLGYKNKKAANFENIQPNFVFRLNLDTSKDKETVKKEVFDKFENKTRYNIKVAKDRGLSVEVYDKDNITDEVLDKFHELMVTTGKRDDFIIRPRQYFKDMIEKIYPYCRIYMVKYDYQRDFDRVNEKLQGQVKNFDKFTIKKSQIEEAIKNEKDEEKLERLNKKLSDAEAGINEAKRQMDTFNERIESIKEYKDTDGVYVSGAVYIYYGGIGWYFYGASHNILRDTMPNFLMQWTMIQDSIDLGCSMYDFRGVSGDLNPENPLYGLYKFKKGFNGKFVQFIGEFDLVADNITYNMFNYVFPRFKEVRKKLKNNK
jgi:peptidoglycan pentaglycine glycine transferase (the first glycine)